MRERIQNRIKYLEGLKADLSVQMESLGQAGQACTTGQLMIINQEIEWLNTLLIEDILI